MAAVTLNVANLQKLGAKHLAETIFDLSKGNTQISKRLQLELAAKLAPNRLSKEIGKRLADIGKATKQLKRTEQKQLAAQLEAQRKLIVDSIKDSDPRESLELLFGFVNLFDSIDRRCDGRTDYFDSIFAECHRNLGDFAKYSKQQPELIAEIYFEWFQKDSSIEPDQYIRSLAPSLGKTGLDHLNSLVWKLHAKELAELKNSKSDPAKIKGYKQYGYTSRALWTIADLRNDVDTYVEYYYEYTNYGEEEDTAKKALGIGAIMLRAGQEKNAIKIIQQELSRNEHIEFAPAVGLMDIKISAYESLQKDEKAQESRLEAFHKFLSFEHLQKYLQKLPDGAAAEAEEKALAYVESFKNVNFVAKFWCDKGDFKRLSEYILNNHKQLDGSYKLTLMGVADALSDQYPLAASLVYRCIINSLIMSSWTFRKEDVVWKIHKICQGLSEKVLDFGSLENHWTYMHNIEHRYDWDYFLRARCRHHIPQLPKRK